MIYKIKKKQIICAVLALLISICATGAFTEAKVAEVQKKMAGEVFRFHVLANSDSKKDQALKMKVKENVIAYMKVQLPESESVEMTKEWAKSHIREIEPLQKRRFKKKGVKMP